MDNLTFRFQQGKLYVITGVSGSGKSTLLHIISGIMPKDHGVLRYKEKELSKKNVVPVLQTAYLFGDLTVQENINIPLLLERKISKLDREELVSLFKITHILKRHAKVCSGGEKARASLVRSLILMAPIVVVDEPTANVDYENAMLIAESLAKFAVRRLIIVTSHQPQLFNFRNVEIIKLSNGKLYET